MAVLVVGAGEVQGQFLVLAAAAVLLEDRVEVQAAVAEQGVLLEGAVVVDTEDQLGVGRHVQAGRRGVSWGSYSYFWFSST